MTNEPTINANGDAVCEHGTAMDVHCCNCHSGFLFDWDACVCGSDDEIGIKREQLTAWAAEEDALAVSAMNNANPHTSALHERRARCLRRVVDLLASAPSAPQLTMAPYASMLELQPNWDSYGAGPIDPRAIEAAKTFESYFSRVPCCTGGVQLEWHALGLDLEVLLAPDGTVESVYAKHPMGEVELPTSASQEEPTQARSAGLIARLKARTREGQSDEYRPCRNFQRGNGSACDHCYKSLDSHLLREALEALSSSAPVERPQRKDNVAAAIAKSVEDYITNCEMPYGWTSVGLFHVVLDAMTPAPAQTQEERADCPACAALQQWLGLKGTCVAHRVEAQPSPETPAQETR